MWVFCYVGKKVTHTVGLDNDLIKAENDYLELTSTEIANQLNDLGKEINVKESEIREFKKLLWESRGSVDSAEMETGLMSSQFEANLMLRKMEKYKKMFKAQYSPYFGRIDFKENKNVLKIYIGITNVTKILTIWYMIGEHQ